MDMGGRAQGHIRPGALDKLPHLQSGLTGLCSEALV